jgi:hypothetical protein
MATIIYKNEISEPMAEDKFSNVLMTLTRKRTILTSRKE